jgi:hypothetical protein
MASQLHYDNVDEMLKSCGIQANDIIAVILSSIAPEDSIFVHISLFFREKLCRGTEIKTEHGAHCYFKESEFWEKAGSFQYLTEVLNLFIFSDEVDAFQSIYRFSISGAEKLVVTVVFISKMQSEYWSEQAIPFKNRNENSVKQQQAHTKSATEAKPCRTQRQSCKHENMSDGGKKCWIKNAPATHQMILETMRWNGSYKEKEPIKKRRRKKRKIVHSAKQKCWEPTFFSRPIHFLI